MADDDGTLDASKEARAVRALVKHCLHEHDPDGLQNLVRMVTRWSTTLTPEDVLDILNTSLDAMPEDVRRWWFFHTLNSPDGGHVRDN